MNITEENRKWVDGVWEKLDNKLRKVCVKSRDKIPYTTENGVHDNMVEKDITWWTNGFWPGMMWLMYEDTKNEEYKITAENAEKLLDGAFEIYDLLHHDVGFMWHLSSGVDYRLTGNKKSRLRTIYAANMLASRYNAAGKFIRSWNEDHNGWVIIDSMMNILLLYWAAKEHNDDRYRYIAENHADTVLRTHIRPDGSVNHIVSLDPTNGEVIESFGGQGYEVGSSWSRGQSWAIYGFVLSYIHTGKETYLNTAKKVANYFIANIPEDGLIPVDFRQPLDCKLEDSTAAAIAACGLLEIAGRLEGAEKEMYRRAALKLLHVLAGQRCRFDLECDNLLEKCTAAFHDKKHEFAIIYGDYYFIEAIWKLTGQEIFIW